MVEATRETCNDTDKTGTCNSHAATSGDMPEFDRSHVVLQFLAEYDIPLRHKAIYGGLIEHNDITFSYKQTRDTVTQLHDDGLLRRVEIDDDEGTVNDIPEEATNRRGYYLISQDGRQRVQSLGRH